jgi:arsenate reductase
MTTLYGIKNCDTVRKAKKWLESEGADYTFHDFRIDGLGKNELSAWVKAVGWEVLLNKRSTSWKQLADKDKVTVDEGKAIALMLANPTLIKRPVLIHKKKIQVGFNPAEYKALF